MASSEWARTQAGKSAERRLSSSQLVAFSLPELALTMMLAPLGSFLPAFYAKYTAIDLAAIGIVLTITRLIDAFTDQIVGFLSDITKSRYGRRKPWIAAGVLVSSISSYYLFNPGDTSGFCYFLTATFFVYLGWTMVATPYYAWGSELTRDYEERTRIFAYVAFAGPIGFLVILGVPLLPMFDTSEIVPETVSLMGVLVVFGLPLLIGTMLFKTPAGTNSSSEDITIGGLIQSFRGNRLFWRFIIAMALSGVGLGMMSATIVLYMDAYLQIGDKIAQSFIPNMLALLAAIYVWTKITLRIGKHQALAWCFAFNALAIPIVLLITPGDRAYLHFLLWMILIGVAAAASVVVPRSLLGDIVDFDEFKHGANRSGNYYAALTLAQKSYGAIGSGAAFFILALFGFEAKASLQSASAVIGLKVALVGLPMLLSIAAMLLIARFPLTAAKHQVIKTRLKQRAERLQTKEST